MDGTYLCAGTDMALAGLPCWFEDAFARDVCLISIVRSLPCFSIGEHHYQQQQQ